MQMKKTAAIALAFAMVSSASLAQNYPNRPITLLVPFAAGGATDTVARVTAQIDVETAGPTDRHRERNWAPAARSQPRGPRARSLTATRC